MGTLVAEASGLVSLGIVADSDPDPLSIYLGQYRVVAPDAVNEELREIAQHDDAHGQAASAVLDRADTFETQAVDLDEEFPLDDGENAAVTVANDIDADFFHCDEFNHLGLIHASLANTRVVTTPTLLSVFVRNDILSPASARDLLDEISDARTWESNSYVHRARSLLETN